MEQTELQSLLNEGIQAVKANDRARARDRLLRVLDANDRNEPAWLWLSAALEDPGDQLMALERVLAINPQHPQALAGAKALRQTLGQAQAPQPPAPTPPEAAPAALEPEKPAAMAGPAQAAVIQRGTPTAAVGTAEAEAVNYDLFQSEDDPYQCAYCGRPTYPEDERCRRCGHGLLAPGPWRGGGYLYLALIITGVQMQSALVQALAAYLAGNYPQALRMLPFASMWAANLQIPAIVRAIGWATVVLLLLGDQEGGYWVAGLVGLADAIWAGFGYSLGVLGQIQAQVNGGLAAIVSAIGLLAVVSQAQSRVRLRVVLDRNLEGGPMFHRRALTYARQGKWALAALHWRRAITRAPREPLYYKALGRANVRLGRFAEAVRAFNSGAEVAPHDREFGRLIERVQSDERDS